MDYSKLSLDQTKLLNSFLEKCFEHRKCFGPDWSNDDQWCLDFILEYHPKYIEHDFNMYVNTSELGRKFLKENGGYVRGYNKYTMSPGGA